MIGPLLALLLAQGVGDGILEIESPGDNETVSVPYVQLKAKIRLPHSLEDPAQAIRMNVEQNPVEVRTRDIKIKPPSTEEKTYTYDIDRRCDLVEGENLFTIKVTTAKKVVLEKQVRVLYSWSPGRLLAVCVGISDYQKVPPLRYAHSDAEHFAEHLTTRLKVPKGHLKMLLNKEATRSAILGAMGWLVEEARAEDTAFVYISGHGGVLKDPNMDDGYEKYLVPHDADPKDVAGTFVSMGWMSAEFKRIKSNRMVVIVDTCHSGSTGRSVSGRIDGELKRGYVDRFSAKVGIIVMTACSPNESSLETEDLKAGLFTHYLLDGLAGRADRDKDGLIGHSELFEYAAAKTQAASFQKQTPMLSLEATGAFPIGGERAARYYYEKPPVFADPMKKFPLEPVPDSKFKVFRHRDLGLDFVLVPGGRFEMGSNDPAAGEDARPQHTVMLWPYLISRTEVTQAQYRKFLQHVRNRHMACHPDEPKLHAHRPSVADPAGDGLPVMGVSWYDAWAFCAWAGGLLPTEAQWEKASRGARGRAFPWGDQFNARAAVLGADHPATVGSMADDCSPYGVMDVVGNVPEWCLDWYKHDTYAGDHQNNPEGPSTGSRRVVRGGSFATRETGRAAVYFRSSDSAEQKIRDRGFRMVLNLVETK